MYLSSNGKWMKNTLSTVKDEYMNCIRAWQPYFEPEPYKELATDNNVVTKSGKDNNVLTIGDKIRESNESLVEYISKFTILADRQRIIDYLNQPYTDTTN